MSRSGKPKTLWIFAVIFIIFIIAGVAVFVIFSSGTTFSEINIFGPDERCYESGLSKEFLRSDIEVSTIAEICGVKVNYLGESFIWWALITEYYFEFEGYGETSNQLTVSNKQQTTFDDDRFSTQYFYSSVFYDRDKDLFKTTVRLY